MNITDIISPTGYIMVSRSVLGMYGSDCAILLCELLSEYQYFLSRGMIDDGYFYSTVDNVRRMTFLNAYAQRKAIATLTEDGVISWKQMGCPPKRYIKINEEVLTQRVTQFMLPMVPDYSIDSKFEPLKVQNLNDDGSKIEPIMVQDLNHPIYNKNKNKNNNDNKDILSGKPDSNLPKIKEIVEYLNHKTGKNFKYNTQKTQSCIKARLKEGFSVDDFKTVINLKTEQWGKDPKMSAYLRPETLFGTKFDGYLNEAPKKKEARSVMTEQERAVAEAKWAKEHGFGYDPKILGEE